MAERLHILLMKPRLGTAATSLTYRLRDLYIQALAELQAVNENDALSYFQIMGECSLSGCHVFYPPDADDKSGTKAYMGSHSCRGMVLDRSLAAPIWLDSVLIM